MWYLGGLVMPIVTGSIHGKLLALFLGVLLVTFVSSVGATVVVPSDDGAQTPQEEANAVPLIRTVFVLEVSLGSTALCAAATPVLKQAPLVLANTNRGPPVLALSSLRSYKLY